MREPCADIPSGDEFMMFISQTRDFGCYSPWFILLTKHTISDQLGAICRIVSNPCNRQLCATGFILCRTRKLAVTHAILTWSWLYIPQDFPLLFIIVCLRTSHFVSLSSSLHFHSSKTWLPKHLSKVRVEQNRAEQWALHPMQHPLRLNYNTDTT